MEAINEAVKLISHAIELLTGLRNQSTVDDTYNHHLAIDLLKTALDKLVVEI